MFTKVRKVLIVWRNQMKGENNSNASNNRDSSLDFIKDAAIIAVLKLHVGWQDYAEYVVSIIQYIGRRKIIV